MKNQVIAVVALTSAGALLLAGCSSPSGGSSGHDMGGMAMPSASSTPAAAAHNAQDVAFAQGMAMHHLQAIEMADVLLAKKGVDSKVAALAERIKAEQKPEIEEMNGWLTSWGQAPVTSSMQMGHDMATMGGGMMSPADMKALADASGSSASSLFLRQMTAHHRGAVVMARTEVTAGRDPRAVTLARSIVTSQTAQIAEMQRLLQQL